MRRIGLYLNNLDEEYQIAVYRKIKIETSRLGYDLICIQGLPSSIIDHLKLDGVLLLTSVLIDYSILKKISQIKILLKNKPAVSMGCNITGMPSVTINSVKSMGELMDHLILNHNYKSLLYLGGPEFHQDNITRQNVFISKIDYYKKDTANLSGNVINGEFHESSAMIQMGKYINENPGKYPDCIVCANDQMALGVKKVLHLQENRRWRECFVTGHDGILKQDIETNKLTTINQPIDELSEISIKMLNDLINNKKVVEGFTIDSILKISSSCGCNTVDKKVTPESILLLESQVNRNRSETIKMDQHLRTVSFFGQRIASIESYSELITHLKGLLDVLNIKVYYLLIYPENNSLNPGNMQLIYKRDIEEEASYLEEIKTISISSLLDTSRVYRKGTPSSLILYHLKSSNEPLGIIIYESEDNSNSHLCTSAVFISNAIKHMQHLNAEKMRSNRLEELVDIRTKDLVETNIKLKKEGQRRLEVEAEVLKISEMERMRFSMDLHDDICQRLGGIAMFSKSLTDTSKLHELSNLIDDTLKRTRQYAHKSFPMDLGNLGLKSALSGLCQELNRQTNIKTSISWTIDHTFSSVEEMNIFRIVQEALNNITKHSRATEIELECYLINGTITISIRDNGIGIPLIEPFTNKNLLDGVRPKGLGLRSMEYRAHQINAFYSISSESKSGTMVKLKIKI